MSAGLGLENPNSGLDLVETFFLNSVSDLDSAETFPKSRNLGLDIDDNVCLLDSQPCECLGVCLVHRPWLYRYTDKKENLKGIQSQSHMLGRAS
jgi:hypothetical protein